MDDQLVHRVVELAIRAPSVHNTQPWRFEATSAGLDLYADHSRQLTVLDPTGRQLTISCGAALGLARLAVAALGYSCAVELLPDDAGADRLARLVIGDPEAATSDDLALAREIARRRTTRDRFGTQPLSPEEREALSRDADRENVSVRWLDRESDRVVLAVLTDRADRIERADASMRAELNRWRRSGTHCDGISPASLPAVPLALRSSDVSLREFSMPDTEAGPADPQHLPLPAERPDLVVLSTGSDGPADWLLAGQAVGRVLLRASTLQLGSSPVGQPLDLAWIRRQLRSELGLTGHPQLILRLGHAHLARAPSPRRPVADVLSHPSPRTPGRTSLPRT